MKKLFPFLLLAALAAGCSGGEPSGDTPAPGVKVSKPGDPGPKPTGGQAQAGGAGKAVSD